MPTQAAVEAVYEDCLPTIRATALRFARSFRRDPEECLAEANYLFLRALRSFRPGGNLDRRVRYVVWNGLMDVLRRDIRRHIPTEPFPGPDAAPEARTPPSWGWDRDEFEADLGDDGRTLAGLILDTPPALHDMIAADRCPGDCAVRRALRAYATSVLGWHPSRYVLAFDDVAGELDGGW